MKERSIEPERLMLSGVCSTCVETLVGRIEELNEILKKLAEE